MNIIRPLALVSLAVIAMPAFANDALSSSPSTTLAQAHVSVSPKFSLSAEQKDKLGALRDKYTLETATKKAELQVAHRQLREVLRADSIDKSAAQALQSKINTLRGDLSNARLSMRLAAADVFTPEQRAQMKNFRHRGGKHFRGKFKGGHGCPSGHKFSEQKTS